LSLLPPAAWLLSDRSGVGQTVRGVPELAHSIRHQCERSRWLRGAEEETWFRLAARRRVAVELADRRLTLTEAAARLRDLSNGDSDLVRARRGGTTELVTGDEVFYREAVAQVRRLPGARRDRAARLRELEMELDGYLKYRLRRQQPRDAHS
jgi:hypothetical protein